jgi:DnaJ-class molecular chaperone
MSNLSLYGFPIEREVTAQAEPSLRVHYRQCKSCRGSGLMMTMAGEPWHCTTCGGNGVTPMKRRSKPAKSAVPTNEGEQK